MTNLRAIFATPKPLTPRTQPPATPVLETPRKTWAEYREETAQSFKNDEMKRILALPRADYSKVPDYTAQLLLSPEVNTWPDGEVIELRKVQNQMLHACVTAGGGLFFAGVGAGKSYAALLAGSVMPDIDRVIVFTPASTVTNLRAEYFKLRLRFKLLPMPALTIRSTEELSRPRTEEEGDLLDVLLVEMGGVAERTLVVFDEAHKLKNLSSSRGARVMRAMRKHTGLRVVAMSGTLISTSVMDVSHIAWYALRAGSPFPCQYIAEHKGKRHLYLESLAACVDDNGKPTPENWEMITPLFFRYYPDRMLTGIRQIPGPERTSMLRQAFQKHLSLTPGVVMTKEASLQGVPLHITGLHPKVPPEVTEKLNQLAAGLDPNGVPIPDDAQLCSLQKQIAQGFYYVWDWPRDSTGKPLVDLKWRGARSLWAKLVREELQIHGRTGYDSEKLVYDSIKAMVLKTCITEAEREWVKWVARTKMDSQTWSGLSDPSTGDAAWIALRARNRRTDVAVAWLDWSAIEKHKPPPPVKGIWLSDYLVDHAIAWAKGQASPPILWYEHREMGMRLATKGIPTFGQGTEPPATSCICALSIGVHGISKNLQDRWGNQLVLCPPASGTTWEQMLGRTHRPGQKRSAVHCYVYQHAEAFVDALNKARSKTAFNQEMTDNALRLLLAEYTDVALRKLTYNKGDDETDVDVDTEYTLK